MSVAEPLTRRATAEYRSATAKQIEEGHAWYPSAHQIARDQATEHLVTIEVSAGILAALSPRLSWGKNVMYAERMLSSLGTLDHGALGRSLAHGRAIYNGADPLDVLKGPKTRAFYLAILTGGESPDPVIDTHAWSMLTGQRGTNPPTDKQYRDGARCMTNAAQRLGLNVHDVQATTWLTWRARFYQRGRFDHTPQPMLDFTVLED
jgi:hypothetical protein